MDGCSRVNVYNEVAFRLGILGGGMIMIVNAVLIRTSHTAVLAFHKEGSIDSAERRIDFIFANKNEYGFQLKTGGPISSAES